MKDSTKDKFEGTAEEIKGKVKEKVGQLTDDPELEAEGTGARAYGELTHVKSSFREEPDRIRTPPCPTGTTARS